jgi:nicotinamidase-related amidase
MSEPLLCNAAQSQLLVIDIQERLVAAMPQAPRAETLSRTGRLLQGAALLEIPTIVTEQYPQGLGATEAVVKQALPHGHRRFEKTSFSCCNASGFCETGLIAGRNQVVITGMETHVCVLQTAFDLQRRGYRVFVAEDAVCSRSADHKRNALERMRQAGIQVTNSESVLFEWLRDSTHEQFRAISKLVR